MPFFDAGSGRNLTPYTVIFQLSGAQAPHGLASSLARVRLRILSAERLASTTETATTQRKTARVGVTQAAFRISGRYSVGVTAQNARRQR